MLSTIIAHKVDHLELFVRTTELPEPGNILIIYIIQNYSPVTERSNSSIFTTK